MLPWVWGEPVPITKAPDEYAGADVRVLTRAVRTSAEPGMVFLWLCQLRRAPYSYDWIDNFGRRSPKVPDPALCELAAGQQVMTIFRLTAFESRRSLTLRMQEGWPTRVFGAITVRYVIEPLAQGESRLSAVLWMPPVGRWLGRARRYLLAWGDVIMMRKQLRVLTAHAERLTPSRATPRTRASASSRRPG